MTLSGGWTERKTNYPWFCNDHDIHIFHILKYEIGITDSLPNNDFRYGKTCPSVSNTLQIGNGYYRYWYLVKIACSKCGAYAICEEHENWMLHLRDLFEPVLKRDCDEVLVEIIHGL
jgi:hypothetical protein